MFWQDGTTEPAQSSVNVEKQAILWSTAFQQGGRNEERQRKERKERRMEKGKKERKEKERKKEKKVRGVSKHFFMLYQF